MFAETSNESKWPRTILSPPGYTGNTYLADPESILELVILCPLCIQGDVEQRLARNGGYPRWIPTSGGQGETGYIFRKYCARCGESFSLLPDFIPKDYRYPCLLIADWLWEAMKGTSCRSRTFLERHGISCPTAGAGMSWAEALEDEPTQPCYQLFSRWLNRFSDRALAAIPTLMTACVLLGRDLKSETERFSDMVAAPVRTYPIAVALYLWTTLRGTGAPLHAEMGPLVHYLLWHRRVPSHERRRAPRRPSGYDGLAVTGRAPPARGES